MKNIGGQQMWMVLVHPPVGGNTEVTLDEKVCTINNNIFQGKLPVSFNLIVIWIIVTSNNIEYWNVSRNIEIKA